MRRTLFLTVIALTMVFVGCDKDEKDKSINLMSANKTLFFGDSYQIEATSETPITYKSENEYHATVSETGLVGARYVGETNIVLSNGNDTKKLKITVTPKSNLYPEPELEFGMSKSDLIAKYGTPDEEANNGKSIVYQNYSNAVPLLAYLFDEEYKLKTVGIYVKIDYSSELGTYLAERYFTVSVNDLIFMNTLTVENNTVLIKAGLSSNANYWLVGYFPYKMGGGSKTDINQSTINEFESLINQLK